MRSWRQDYRVLWWQWREGLSRVCLVRSHQWILTLLVSMEMTLSAWLLSFWLTVKKEASGSWTWALCSSSPDRHWDRFLSASHSISPPGVDDFLQMPIHVVHLQHRTVHCVAFDVLTKSEHPCNYQITSKSLSDSEECQGFPCRARMQNRRQEEEGGCIFIGNPSCW